MFESVEIRCDKRGFPGEGGEGVLIVEGDGGDKAEAEGAEAGD